MPSSSQRAEFWVAVLSLLATVAGLVLAYWIYARQKEDQKVSTAPDTEVRAEPPSVPDKPADAVPSPSDPQAGNPPPADDGNAPSPRLSKTLSIPIGRSETVRLPGGTIAVSARAILGNGLSEIQVQRADGSRALKCLSPGSCGKLTLGEHTYAFTVLRLDHDVCEVSIDESP